MKLWKFLLWMPQIILDLHLDLLLLVNSRLNANQYFWVLVWLIVCLISYLSVSDTVWNVKGLSWHWQNNVVTVYLVELVLNCVFSGGTRGATKCVLLLLLLILNQTLVSVLPNLSFLTVVFCLASSENISLLWNKIRQRYLRLFRIYSSCAGNSRRKVDPLVLAAVVDVIIFGFSFRRETA